MNLILLRAEVSFFILQVFPKLSICRLFSGVYYFLQRYGQCCVQVERDC